MNQKMKNTNSTKPTPMQSLPSSDIAESVPPPEVIPEVVPAIGRTLMFEPEDRRVGVCVGVRGVDVDHEEPDELCDEEPLCDEVLDEREEL